MRTVNQMDLDALSAARGQEWARLDELSRARGLSGSEVDELVTRYRAASADLADIKTEIRAWLAGCGFAAQRPLTRMLYRRATSFDDTSRTFAVVGPEFG